MYLYPLEDKVRLYGLFHVLSKAHLFQEAYCPENRSAQLFFYRLMWATAMPGISLYFLHFYVKKSTLFSKEVHIPLVDRRPGWSADLQPCQGHRRLDNKH